MADEPLDERIFGILIQDELVLLDGICEIGKRAQAARDRYDYAFSGDAHEFGEHALLVGVSVGDRRIERHHEIELAVLIRA